jgi:hypothetical protein
MGKLRPLKSGIEALAMWRIEQKQGNYYVCEYKQKGPFQALKQFIGPLSRLDAEGVLAEQVEKIWLQKLEDYANVQDRNS